MLVIALGLTACASPAKKMEESGQLTRLPPISSAEIGPISGLATSEFLTPEKLGRGYTIVVVGVNGDNILSAGLAPGIVEGGYAGAVEVLDWTTGYWPLFIYHLRSNARHDRGAKSIEERVLAYRRQYPGRELNLVAYSAGAAVALEAIEELPEGESIDRLVLLAGAVSPAYDLRPVLSRCRIGMWNYYQPQDVLALWAGTMVAGTADGQHLMSAGAVGFWPSSELDATEKHQRKRKLVQMPYDHRMALSGNLGGHFQCVQQRFVAQWIAPVLRSPSADVKPEVATAHGSAAVR